MSFSRKELQLLDITAPTPMVIYTLTKCLVGNDSNECPGRKKEIIDRPWWKLLRTKLAPGSFDNSITLQIFSRSNYLIAKTLGQIKSP